MPIVADAAVAVRGDLSPFQKDLAGAGKQVQGLGDRIKGALSPKNLLLGAGGALAGAQVFSFLTDSISAASDLNETISKTGVVIGQDSLPKLEAWAETAADTFGQSKRQALDAASQFAVFGKSAGLAGDDLAGFSTDLTELASDMASFSNTSPEEAITAIGAALRGESEPIRRYGVLIDDASLRQKALELGIISTTKNALTPQQRVLAAQALIMEQTADAQGDFARTSDGLANTQRTLSARFEDVQASIGEKLLPIALEFANFVSDVLLPALSFLTDNVLGPLSDGIGNVANSFREAAGDVNFFAMNFGDQGDRVHQIADDFGVDFDELKDRIRDRMLETGESFTEAADTIESEMERAKLEGSASAWELQQEISAAAVAGAASARAEATGVANAVPDAIAEHWEEIRQSGEDTYVAWKTGFYDGQESIKSDIEAFLKSLETHMDPEEEIMYLEGQRAILEHERAIRDNDPFAQAAIDDMIADINRRLQGLNGYVYGKNLVVTLANGIRTNLGTASLASAALSRVIAGPVIIESEPPDPKSGLRGITTWGGNIVKTIAEGIYGSLGTASNATSALAGALVPSLGIPALATGTMASDMASLGGGGGNTYVLNVNGAERVFSSRDDFIQALDDLGAFGEGRL